MDIGFLMMLYTLPFPWVWNLGEKIQVLPSFESLIDDGSIVNDELSLLASNIRKEVIKNIDYFQKKGKKFKRFKLSPQVVLEKLCVIFSFMKEKKTKNPTRHPFQNLFLKILTTNLTNHL
jgi:hypothetical protein